MVMNYQQSADMIEYDIAMTNQNAKPIDAYQIQGMAIFSRILEWMLNLSLIQMTSLSNSSRSRHILALLFNDRKFQHDVLPLPHRTWMGSLLHIDLVIQQSCHHTHTLTRLTPGQP